MLEINYGSKFKKDYKRVIKRPGHKPEIFANVVRMLSMEETLLKDVYNSESAKG